MPSHIHLYGNHVADVIDTGDGATAVQYTEETVAHAGSDRHIYVALALSVELAGVKRSA